MARILSFESRRWLRRVLISAGVMALALGAFTTSTAFARPAPVVRTVTHVVTVPTNVAFTDSGVALTKGGVFSITATGVVHFDSTRTTTPQGASFSGNTSSTNACAFQAYRGPVFAVPSVNCWSLVGRIGAAGTPFFVGKKFSMKSPLAGELFLGFNDNLYSDNTGTFTAMVTTS